MSECESCVNYVWDEDWEQYVCAADLDEDEMGRFLGGTSRECHSYRLDDEYGVVRKQL
ncbi:MAG: DUF6472 family protein [Prevotella sp.]|nr:DUF6472 family protein [Prevotella sp.]